jgi:hypothetical protein
LSFSHETLIGNAHLKRLYSEFVAEGGLRCCNPACRALTDGARGHCGRCHTAYVREWRRRRGQSALDTQRYQTDPVFREFRRAHARETMRRLRARRAAEAAVQKEKPE